MRIRIPDLRCTIRSVRAVSGWSSGARARGAPQWASLVAIANQGRTLASKTALDGKNQLLPALYAMPASAFYDVASGSSTGSPNYAATAGL